MAQFYRLVDDYPEGISTVDLDFISRDNALDRFVEEDPLGNYIDFVGPGERQHSQFVFDPEGNVESTVQECLLLGRLTGGSPRFHFMFFNDTSDDRTFYRVGLRDGGTEIASYLDGSFQSHATGSTSFSQTEGKVVGMRGQAILDSGVVTLKLRVWEVTDFEDWDTEEPSGWNIETTTSRFIASGKLGLWHWSDPVLDTFVFNVGTDGDSAPTSMAGAPTNLQAVDITDTSARLVWDAPT